MKYWLWAGTLGILALFGFILSSILSGSHPSLAEQARESVPSTTPGLLTASTPPDRSEQSLANEHFSETQEAPSPAPAFNDPAKQAALEALVRAKTEMQSMRPPQVSGAVDSAIIGGAINSYVNEMGQKAQAYNQARQALQEHLSKQEAARLSQILAQP